ncbi:Ig-like domain-containing protein, partial [Lelliottia nimipressuralis]
MKCNSLIQWGHHCFNGILLLLLLAVFAVPATAVISEPAGKIEGQPPGVAGQLQVLFPDGKTVVTNDAILGLNQTPGQFRVSASTDALELEDADGDTGLNAVVDTQSATLTWKNGDTVLTPEQLVVPFGEHLAGRTLTLDVNAPVTASSETGRPTTAEPKILFSSYTLAVPLPGIAIDDFSVAGGAVADGQASNALSATVKDAHGNLLSDVDVTFTVTEGAAMPATQTVKTNENGIATGGLVSTVAGENQVTATVANTTTGPKTSIFIADESTAIIDGTDYIVATGAVADGSDSNALSATVRDAHGNFLSDVDVTFTVTEGAATPATQIVKTDDNGVAKAQIVSTVVGENQVTVTSLGSSPAPKVSAFTP